MEDAQWFSEGNGEERPNEGCCVDCRERDAEPGRPWCADCEAARACDEERGS